MTIEECRSFIDREHGKQEILKQNLQSVKKIKISCEKRVKGITEAQVLIQKVAVETQQQIKVHLEDIVNKIMQTSFPDYSFSMEYKISHNKSECYLHFYEGSNETDLLDGDSGGALNVACIALRMSVWTISSTDNCLILDEAFANLSQDLQPLIGHILSELSKELNLQTILVSHSPSIDAWADRVYLVTKTNKVSNVK